MTACTCLKGLNTPNLLAMRRARWRVIQRRCNYSAFNGYRYTPSRYSLVHCRDCGALWRTTAKYVDQLEDGS